MGEYFFCGCDANQKIEQYNVDLHQEENINNNDNGKNNKKRVSVESINESPEKRDNFISRNS